MNEQNRITLKGIKHAAFASQETHCYEASVYFDGKRIGTVSNEGHGGCDYERISDKDGWSKMEAYIETLPKEEQYDLDQSLELICGDLVNNWLTDRDLKRLLKTKFLWQKENGEVFQCRYDRKKHTIEEMQNLIAKTEPTAKLLNAMPIEEARKIYCAIG